jgi:hypothetical protein
VRDRGGAFRQRGTADLKGLLSQQPERVASLTVLCPAVLDTRTPILNVALPHIQGSLSASLDQIAWALTSYIETGRYNAGLGIEHLHATIGRDGIAFGAYLGKDGITREAVLRIGPAGLAEIAVEGAPAPGGGHYVGFGPWPTVGPDGMTAFIAALDGGPGPLAAFAGAAGDIRRVARMGERLPQGESIGRFALNAVAVEGPRGALTIATVAESEGQRNAIYCKCPEQPR